MSTTTIRLSVEDWGPIEEGSVEIRPLTIFIGPNNTGKSYLAMLFYSLALAISKLSGSFRFVRRRKRLRSELEGMVSALIDAYLEKKSRDLTEELGSLLSEALSAEIASRLPVVLREELERVYSSRVGALVRLGSAEARMKLAVSSPLLEFLMASEVTPEDKLELEELKLSVKQSLIKGCMKLIDLYLFFPRRRVEPKISKAVIRKELEKVAPELVWRLTWRFEATIRAALRDALFGGNIHYLPASRAGILHSYRSIARALISLAPIAPVRGVEIPGIPGPLADFLGELILMGHEPEEEGPIKAIARSLEREVLEGEVALLRQPPEAPPALVFKFDGGSLPIAMASSMIAEAAPLSILLKYGTVRPGDTLIVEEPEAHLHPDKQAKLAILLAKLVNEAGVRLLITTHSDVLLAKLSNLVSLSAIPPDEARELGHDPSAALPPEKVAVYSFEPGPGGVRVVPVKVTEEGIPDEVFRRVLERLYEETMDLYYRLQASRGARRGHGGAEGGGGAEGRAG